MRQVPPESQPLPAYDGSFPGGTFQTFTMDLRNADQRVRTYKKAEVQGKLTETTERAWLRKKHDYGPLP